MERSFTVTLTTGTNPGPYNIYYDQVDPNNLATKYGTSDPASGFTLAEVQAGVNITVPGEANSVIFFNTDPFVASDCETNQVVYDISDSGTANITPTPTYEATPTPTLTLTPTLTPTLTITPTHTPTVTPEEPTPTPTPEEPTPTPTPTPTVTPCRTMGTTEYTYSYDSLSSTTACGSEGTSVTVYTTGDLPFTGVVLYSDISGCNTASAGYYSNGTEYFTVDQYGEITASDNCVGDPPPPTVYEVGQRTDTGAPFSISACGDTCDTTLLASVETFDSVGVGTIIYSDTDGTLFAGGDTWYGIASSAGSPSIAIVINNSGEVTNDTVCATPTPTPTLTPTITVTPTNTLNVYFRQVVGNSSSRTLYYTVNGGSQQTAYTGSLNEFCGPNPWVTIGPFEVDDVIVFTPDDSSHWLAGNVGEANCPSSAYDVGHSYTYTITGGVNNVSLSLDTNQLVLTQVWSDSQPGAGNLSACDCPTETGVYNFSILGNKDINSDLTNSTIYDNNQGNGTFLGDEMWYCITTTSGSTMTISVQIDNSGNIIDWADCSTITPTPTRTPTPTPYAPDTCLTYDVDNYDQTDTLIVSYTNCATGQSDTATFGPDSSYYVCSLTQPTRSGGSNAYNISGGYEDSVCNITPTPTPTAPTPTPTPQTAYWFELTNCETNAVCYSVPIVGDSPTDNLNKVFWSAGGNYYRMGNFYDVNTDIDPGVGDCSAKLEGTIVTGTCSDYVTVQPTPTAQTTQDYQIRECGTTSPTYYVNLNATGLEQGFAVKIQSQSIFNGTKCWEIVDPSPGSVPIDATATLTESPYYTGCDSCTPVTPTPTDFTPTPTPTPEETVTLYRYQYCGGHISDNPTAGTNVVVSSDTLAAAGFTGTPGAGDTIQFTGSGNVGAIYQYMSVGGLEDSGYIISSTGDVCPGGGEFSEGI